MKGFSYPYNPEIHAAARGTGINISPKAAREVCRALKGMELEKAKGYLESCLLYTSPSPRDGLLSRMPSSA